KQSARHSWPANRLGAIIALARGSITRRLQVCDGKLRKGGPGVKCDMRFVVFGGLFLLVVSCVHAESRFEFATTPGKLPKDVTPREYSIRIEPDLEKLTFTGSETIRLRFDKPQKTLVLNALELEIISAAIDGTALPRKGITLNANEQLLNLSLPNE